MYRVSRGHKFILGVADEVTNYLAAIFCIDEPHIKLESCYKSGVLQKWAPN